MRPNLDPADASRALPACQELEEHLDEGEWPGSRCVQCADVTQQSDSQT